MENKMTLVQMYASAIKTIWTSPLWYLFIFAVFGIGLGGTVNHPIAVALGVIVVGCLYFPTLAILMAAAQNAIKR